MTRRICYISGTRADFGLMQSTLKAIDSHADLSLSVLVTGMHLHADYGETVNEIQDMGLHIGAKIPVNLLPDTGGTMARNLGIMIKGFVDYFEKEHFDIVLLLGDRGEMLAGAIACIHLNIPVAHIHGGERSGTVDEPIRHAISKLAHLHFVATEGSKNRLIRMGENTDNIWVTGAPGLDGLSTRQTQSRDELCEEFGFRSNSPIALLVFHPVLQESEEAESAMRLILDTLKSKEIQVLTLMPNSDAGNQSIRDVLLTYSSDPSIRVIDHIPRQSFIAWMACCDFMVGNSSAGIIEAGSFGVPVLNIGSRQNFRERNSNVLDVGLQELEILEGIETALKLGHQKPHNIYGDGHAAMRITELLANTPIDNKLLFKINAY